MKKLRDLCLPVCVYLASPALCVAETTTMDKIQVSSSPVSDVGDVRRSAEDASKSTLETAPSEIDLSVEELKGVAGTQGDPLKAVGVLPGIATAAGNQGRDNGFYVRGSNANENLIWVDGLPIGYIYHLGGRFSVLNPDLVDNFQTYLGGFGVEYGDRLGGMVSVNTRAPYQDRLHQSYQLGLYDSSARIEGPVSENGSAFFAIRRSYIDLLLPATGSLGDSGNTYKQFPEFWDMQARYRHELPQGFVDVTLLTAEDQFKFDIQSDKYVDSDPAIAGDLGGQQQFQTLGVRWHQQLAPQWMQKVRVGVSQTESKFIIGTQQVGDPNPGESYGIDGKTVNAFLLPQWQWDVSGQQRWKLGLDASQVSFDVSGYISQPCREGQPDCNLTKQSKSAVNQTETGTVLDPYLEVKQSLSSRLFATLGVRSTHIDIGQTQLSATSPRLNLEYDLTDNAIVTASWGKYVQMPQGYELIDGIGNPSLVMTEAEHRILGIKLALSDDWSTQIEAFHKPMTKLVVQRAAPENYANEGSGFAQGFDVLLKKQWRNRSYGWVSYSYLETERRDDGNLSKRLFDGDQPHTLNVVWNQPFGGSWSKWVWGASMQLHSGQPYTQVIGREGAALPGSSQTPQACQSDGDQSGCYWQPIYGQINGDRLPFYFNLDLGMERQWQWGDAQMMARFELLNVTGLLRANVLGYRNEGDYSNYQNPEEISDFPFLPSFSIRATF